MRADSLASSPRCRMPRLSRISKRPSSRRGRLLRVRPALIASSMAAFAHPMAEVLGIGVVLYEIEPVLVAQPVADSPR